MTDDIFVFGSNLAGRHGKGAALTALQKFGARMGQGEGLQGHSYALPTKEEPHIGMKLADIQRHVEIFLQFARDNPGLTFHLTPVGCGLAGYDPLQIAPMFVDHPSNVILPGVFITAIQTAMREHDWTPGEPPKDGSAYVVETDAYGQLRALWDGKKWSGIPAKARIVKWSKT